MERRDFIKLSILPLASSIIGCSGTKTFPLRITPFPLSKFSSKKKIIKIFESKEDPLTLKYLMLYRQLIEGMKQLLSEYKSQGYIKLSDFMNLYSIPLFKLIQTFIYITLLKISTEKPQVLRKGYNFIIPPGAILSYKYHGFCMNHDYPAPVNNDLLRLEPISKIGLPPELLSVLKCVVLNKKKFRNPQGVVWFLVELDRIPYSELFKGKYSNYLKELGEICPNSRETILSYKRSQLPKELLVVLLKQFKVKIGYKTYTLDSLIFDPNVTQELLNELIQRGRRTPGPKGPGYSEISKDVYAKSIGIAPLTGKVKVLNFSDRPIPFSPLDYYLQPAAKKQRISPTSDVENVSAYLPVPSKSEAFYQSIMCNLVNVAKKIFGEIFPERGDDLLKKFAEEQLEKENSKLRKLLGEKIAKFLAKILKETPLARGMGVYEFLCGKSFLFCESLSCKDRIIAFVSVFSPDVADILSEVTDRISQYIEIIKKDKGKHSPIVIDEHTKPIIDFLEKCNSYSKNVTMSVCDTLCITTWFKGDPFSHKTTLSDIIIDCQSSNH